MPVISLAWKKHEFWILFSDLPTCTHQIVQGAPYSEIPEEVLPRHGLSQHDGACGWEVRIVRPYVHSREVENDMETSVYVVPRVEKKEIRCTENDWRYSRRGPKYGSDTYL